uniref:Uncharacterized protein n=1 Tax=Nomascus leucogenys TaxID=61853 RepID=A0A2I3GUP7_NOMLE
VGRASYGGSPVGHQSSSDHPQAKASRSPVRDGTRTACGVPTVALRLHFLREASSGSRTCGRRTSLCTSAKSSWTHRSGRLSWQSIKGTHLTITQAFRRPLHRAPLLPGRLCWSPHPLEKNKAMGWPLLLPLLLLLLLPVFLQPGLREPALSELDRGSEERLPQDLEPAEGGPVCVFLPSRAGHTEIREAAVAVHRGDQTLHHPGCHNHHHLEAQQHNHHSRPQGHRRRQRTLRIMVPKCGHCHQGGIGCRCAQNCHFGSAVPPQVEEKER